MWKGWENLFSRPYTNLLESRLSELRDELIETRRLLTSREQKIDDLTERLLSVKQVPLSPDKQHLKDLDMMDTLQQTQNIFEDLDEPEDEEDHITNRVSEFTQ